jgi:hypothetical protein
MLALSGQVCLMITRGLVSNLAVGTASRIHKAMGLQILSDAKRREPGTNLHGRKHQPPKD